MKPAKQAAPNWQNERAVARGKRLPRIVIKVRVVRKKGTKKC